MEMEVIGGPMIIGFHLEVFLMLLSGLFYLACALFLFKQVRRDKNELVNALFAFLIYQAISMFFMGLEMHTMNHTYGYIAALSILIGSAYMLKFPFSSFSQRTRRIIFMFSLIVVLGLFIWFIQTEARAMALMSFVLWYDLVINGIVVGGFILLLAVRTTEYLLKIKAWGGSTGVLACCVAANATMISGAMLTSSVFQFIAPVAILGALGFARMKQRQMIVPTSTPTQSTNVPA